MIIKINRAILFFVILILAVSLAAVIAIMKILSTSNAVYLGGVVQTISFDDEWAQPAANVSDNDYSERYQRPSKQAALKNKYNLQSFMDNPSPPVLQNPEDVLYAYYGILKEAANMEGYSGGCGSIGDSKAPYPYAYQLLTQDARKKMSQKQFEDSFKGTGHITLLKLYPAFAPPNTPPDTKYFVVEIEVITGPKESGEQFSYQKQLSTFAYYYGIVTVKKEATGWKIQDIMYLPEEFLCAPYHSWFYDSDSVVQFVYKDGLKIIDKITGTEEKNGIISIYATGNGKKYRFDFLRLTNGHDVLLHEYIYTDGKWVETDLLTKDWKNLKLSVSNSNFVSK